VAILTPLVVVVGPTASGKSAMGLELAKRFNGEIICADSRTIYKYMDIGTAKPSPADQAEVPHHLLDLTTPDQKFTVADFKTQALMAIEDISSRGKLPIMVGGTGLYVDSVLFDYQFSNPNSERDDQNPRHLKKSAAPRLNNEIRNNTLVIGLEVDKGELKQRIIQRMAIMHKQGLAKEAEDLAKRYGWEAPGLLAIGYREWQNHSDTQEVIEEQIRNTVKYAKRQMTWFRRNKSIHWLVDPSDAVDITTKFLNKAS
jgi:tRNA dimethylallyltransferase